MSKETRSLLLAIRERCLECAGTNYARALCPRDGKGAPKCALWPYRFGALQPALKDMLVTPGFLDRSVPAKEEKTRRRQLVRQILEQPRKTVRFRPIAAGAGRREFIREECQGLRDNYDAEMSED